MKKRGRGYPIGRIGQAKETAATATCLASCEAAEIDGAIIPVDGGKGDGGRASLPVTKSNGTDQWH